MSKKVDIDLIVAFIEGSLSAEKRKFVRNLIDNDNEWFLEYMNLKEGEFEYNKYAGIQNSDSQKFSANFSASKNENIFASFAALSPFYSAAILGVVTVGAASLLFMDAIKEGFKSVIKISGNEAVSERFISSEDFTEIDYSSSESISITSRYIDDLYVSIYIKQDNISSKKIPSDAYFLKLISGDELIVSYQSLYEFYQIDISSKVPFIITIYDSKEKIFQELIIE